MGEAILVKEITFEEGETLRTESTAGKRCGDMVAVRPCAAEYENKTFLGVLIGDIALSIGATLDQDDVLTIRRQRYNPAIFIPEKNAVVYGCGSWWGKIESEDQLKNISDKDIESIWYVKALRQIEQNSSRNPASLGAGQASPYQSLADMALDCLICFSDGGVLCCSI